MRRRRGRARRKTMREGSGGEEDGERESLPNAFLQLVS